MDSMITLSRLKKCFRSGAQGHLQVNWNDVLTAFAIGDPVIIGSAEFNAAPWDGPAVTQIQIRLVKIFIAVGIGARDGGRIKGSGQSVVELMGYPGAKSGFGIDGITELAMAVTGIKACEQLLGLRPKEIFR